MNAELAGRLERLEKMVDEIHAATVRTPKPARTPRACDWTPEQDDALRALWPDTSLTIAEIAARLPGPARTAKSAQLHARMALELPVRGTRGLHHGPRAWPAERKERLAALWADPAKTAGDIAEALGVSKVTVYQKRVEFGLPPRREPGAAKPEIPPRAPKPAIAAPPAPKIPPASAKPVFAKPVPLGPAAPKTMPVDVRREPPPLPAPVKPEPVAAHLPVVDRDAGAEPVPVSVVEKFLRTRDFQVDKVGPDQWLLDKRTTVNRAGLLAAANRHRAKMRKPDFRLEGA